MDLTVLQAGGQVSQESLPNVLNMGNVQIATTSFLTDVQLRSANRAGLKHREFTFPGFHCFVLFKDLDFYEFPHISFSTQKKSQAVYLAEKELDDRTLLLQYMAPGNKKTSVHYHERTTEVFHNLEGESYLYVEDDRLPLRKASVILDPWHVHQVRTNCSASLTLIEMVNCPKVPHRMDDHFYVDESRLGFDGPDRI